MNTKNYPKINEAKPGNSSSLGNLLRPEFRARPKLDSTPKGSSDAKKLTPFGSSKSQTRVTINSNYVSDKMSAERPSQLSARSTDQVGDTESGALSSKLITNQASGGRPQLPRLNMPPARTDLMPPLATASHAGRRGIRLPTPMNFPQSTKNQNSQQMNKFSQQLTPSSRARMQAHTNITSRENEDNSSMRYGQTSGTGRFGTGGILMSPTGGGSRSIQINTAISQNVDDDVPEELDDDEIRSVSTLYNAADAKKKMQQTQLQSIKLREINQQRRQVDNGAFKSKIPVDQNNNDDEIALVEIVEQNSSQPSPFPKTTSSNNNQQSKGSSNVLDSFSNFFAKEKVTAAPADNTHSSLATGERPWYYFEGNNTNSSSSKTPVTPGEQVQVDQRSVGITGNKEQAQNSGKQNQVPSLPPRTRLVSPLKIQTNSRSLMDQNQNHASTNSLGNRGGTPQNKDSSTIGGAVDLYSTSNINTPNMPVRQSTKRDNMAQLRPPLRNDYDNQLPIENPKSPAAGEDGGRITLRSVHLSSTEDMKEDGGKEVNQAKLYRNDTTPSAAEDMREPDESKLCFDSAGNKNALQNDEDQLMPMSPAITVRKPKQAGVNKLIKSTPAGDQKGVESAMDIQGHHINLKMENRIFKNPNAAVSSSHKDNLFVPTEKARLLNQAQQKSLDGPFPPRDSIEVINSPVRFSNNRATVNFSKQQTKILTPSFISTEMLATKLRRSDLLLKKKEPSQIDTNRRHSLDGQDQAEDILSMDHSMCSPGGCIGGGSALRESRFSMGGNQKQQAAAMIVNQMILRNSIGFNNTSNGKDRPIIFGAGSPAAIQPNIRDSESSMMLANSSRFSQQLQSTFQSVKAVEKSQDLQNGNSKSSKSGGKRRGLPSNINNTSGVRQSSSFSKKSIRKSTTDGDDKEVTSFAYYVQNLFSNLFGCCGSGTGGNQAAPTENSVNLNSSINSNVLRYSFVAVPNHNSISLAADSSNKEQQSKNGNQQVRRSKLIQDFKGEQKKQDKKQSKILEEEKLDQEMNKQNIVVHCRESLQSDIVDVDDDDHIANAQRPLQSQRNQLNTPRDRIQSNRALPQNNDNSNTNQNSSQLTTSRVSHQRITAGTVEIATQLTSDSQVDEFVFQKPSAQNGNPFQVRPLREYLAEDDDGDENYCTSETPAKGPASQIKTLQQKLPQNAQVSNYEVPYQLKEDGVDGDEETSPVDSDLDYQAVKLPVGAISHGSTDSPDKQMSTANAQVQQQQQDQQQRKKRSLKDMITQVPQSTAGGSPMVAPQHNTRGIVATNQTRSAKTAMEDLGSRPSLMSNGASNKSQEDDAMSSEFGEECSDEDFEDGEETPDVQKIHFNQTVQALFNIRATNLTMPPFHQIRHQLVELPEPNHPSKTKTIVFDLDETLIHCVDDVDTDNPDVVIPIQFSEEPEPVLAGINIRPFARECLEAANEHFQVVIFTASEQEYADPIIDYLDPEGILVQARYYRPSCVRTRNPDFYIKDMRIFHQRNLSDIILVDNSVYSFAFQLDNGVPIVSFYNDPKDEEMLHLKFYLECLKDCDDVREKNKEAFQLMQLAETQLQRIIEEQNRMHQTQQEQQIQQMSSAVSPSAQQMISDEDDEYSPYQSNYRLPEQAQYINSNNFVLEENEEDEEDELARDSEDRSQIDMKGAGDATDPIGGHHQQYYQQNNNNNNIYDQHHNGNIMEEEDEYEEEESFECRL